MFYFKEFIDVKKTENFNFEVALDQFTEKLSRLFTEKETNKQARKTQFVQRESKLTGHLFMSIFTFGISLYGTPSLQQLVGLLNRIVPDLNIRREALQQRINDEAVAFFEAMLSLSIQLEIPNSFDINLLAEFARILIFDSTSFQLPDTVADYFRGNGGDSSEAAIKILFGYDLKSAHFFYHLQNGRDADHLVKSGAIETIEANDLEISDLGFFNIKAFADIGQKGAYYLSRMKTNVNTYQLNADGELIPFDLAQFCQQIDHAKPIEIEICLKSGKVLLVTRLIIERVPDEVKAKRLRDRNKINQKQGQKTNQRTKILYGFSLYITNVPVEILPPTVIRQVYAIRWQIELVFKIWKSNFSLNQITGTRPQRIKCLIYAKLLFVLITTQITHVARAYAWETVKREVSPVQAANHLKIIAEEWLPAIIRQQFKVIKELMQNAIQFIAKACLKCKSKNRIYTLELLDQLQQKTLA